MATAEAAPRVALLARPGAACERLQVALREAGAELVLVADPSDADVDSVRAADVQAIVVALEPAVEEVLARFDTLFDDPSMMVIFDEADSAARREGWDAARWVRHLAAKLGRHDDVLPPGAEAELSLALESEPLALYQRPESDGNFAPFTEEADALAATLPKDRGGAVRTAGTGLELQPAEAVVDAQPPDDPATSDRFRRDIDELQERIAAMELVDDRTARDMAGGAVVVLAGIGGPDAVRQLLGALPPGFPRPVLIQQRLDGARHDKLVRQMQRATAMPVQLAEAGAGLQRGHVYVLPSGIGVAMQDGVLHFVEGPEPLSGLPASDSAVIMLSGSDASAVDAAMGLSWAGALVAGQTPDGCYDAVASQALIARGADAGTPMELATKLAARWPA